MSPAQTVTDIRQRVCELAAEQAGIDPSEISDASRFVEDLDFDSLDMVEFIMNVDDAFDLNTPDEVAERTKTVGDAADLVIAALSLPASKG